MAVGFETLIYTDCRPGQGLKGTPGFQWQARSPGSPREIEGIAEYELLYQPPPNWMQAQPPRPASDYPPSFAHISVDRHFITAAGIYLGRAANDAREGNQLTHCIVTDDPTAYSPPLRPAQLFRAPFWVTRPAPTTTCDPIAPGWQPGPLGVEEVRDFVRRHDDGPKMLGDLLATLQRIAAGESVRVMFISDDIDAVMSWIVAGTLLLPYEQALRIGFRVFTTDPSRARQPVVGVHPEWQSTVATVNNDLGYVVFDLTRGEWSRTKPDPVASFWAEQFCGGDPFDVMDAVEVAYESGLTGADAALIGRVAVLDDPLVESNAAVVVSWLRTSKPDVLANYRGQMVDRLLANIDQWPETILQKLDELVRLGQVPPEKSAAVRLALIRVEIARAFETGAVPADVVPQLPDQHWSEQHQHEAEAMLLDALRRAEPATFAALLQIGRRFQLAVEVAHIGQSLERFVLDWSQNPGRPYDVRTWAAGEEILDHLVDVLNARVPYGIRAYTMARQWLPHLGYRLDRGQFDGPLYTAMLGVALAERPPADRGRLVRDVLAHAERSDPDTAGRLINALYASVPPTMQELAWIAEYAPPGTPVEQRHFRELGERMARDDLTVETLDLARRLHWKSILVGDSHVTAVLDQDELLTWTGQRLREPMSDREFGQLTERVTQVSPVMVRLHRDDLIRATLHVADPRRVLALITALKPIGPSFYATLVDRVRKPGLPEHAATAFYLAWLETTPERDRRDLNRVVSQWLRAADGPATEKAGAIITELGQSWPDLWREQVARTRGRGLRGRLFGGRTP